VIETYVETFPRQKLKRAERERETERDWQRETERCKVLREKRERAT